MKLKKTTLSFISILKSYDLAVTFISNWCLTFCNNLTKMFRKFV